MQVDPDLSTTDEWPDIAKQFSGRPFPEEHSGWALDPRTLAEEVDRAQNKPLHIPRGGEILSTKKTNRRSYLIRAGVAALRIFLFTFLFSVCDCDGGAR